MASMNQKSSVAQTPKSVREVLTSDRDGDKLAENWVFIDVLHFMRMQGVDVLANIGS